MEKTGVSGFRMTSPSGGEVLFRCHGLQVIPNEAAEIDTHHACQLVITPLAAGLSGLIISTLRILCAGEEDRRRMEAAVSAYADLLKSDRSDGWELRAAKNIVSAALKVAETPLPPPPDELDSEWFMLGSHHGPLPRRRANARKDRPVFHSFLESSGLEGFFGTPIQSSGRPGKGGHEDSIVWLTIRDVAGVVLENFWIPVHLPKRPLSRTEECEIIRSIVRKKLRPEIAISLFAEMSAKSLRKKR